MTVLCPPSLEVVLAVVVTVAVGPELVAGVTTPLPHTHGE